MQPIKFLEHWLSNNANEQQYLFCFQDLRALFPALSDAAFKTLLSRAVNAGLLHRVCRGIYLYKKAYLNDGRILYFTAHLLRANEFNYLSLESVLSEAGIISQVPINWITIMTSGRSNTIGSDDFGTIEFIHTKARPEALIDELNYDPLIGLWRASIPLALNDMKKTQRNCDLIDWDIANDFIR